GGRARDNSRYETGEWRSAETEFLEEGVERGEEDCRRQEWNDARERRRVGPDGERQLREEGAGEEERDDRRRDPPRQGQGTDVQPPREIAGCGGEVGPSQSASDQGDRNARHRQTLRERGDERS